MNSKRLLGGLGALIMMWWVVGVGTAQAQPQYSWKGISFLGTGPVPQNTGLGTYFNFFNNNNDSYGLPANLLFGAWVSVWVDQRGFYGPNGTRVAGAPEGSNVWANVAYINWIYPFQFDTPNFRVGFNAFMPIVAAGPIGGPTEFWFTPLEMFYSYHQFRYLRDSTFFGPYFSLPVGGGFGFTPANGVVNQYNFAWLSEGWYQLQHMDELAVGNMGLGWLNTLEFQPFFSYTHQLNTTPGLPAAAAFGCAGGVCAPASIGNPLAVAPASGGYMPGDNISAGGLLSYGLKQINPELGPWRIGFAAYGTVTAFSNVFAGAPIKNSGVEAVSVGPSLQYAKGDFVLWFYYLTNVRTWNYYNWNFFMLQLYYFFNL